MKTNAKGFRTKSDNPLPHDEMCVFAYFLPEFQRHTTQGQLDDVLARMIKGYFDKELNEKAKLMDPQLNVWDFRFLGMITGNMKVEGPKSSVNELEEKAEVGDLQLFEAKLLRETNLWANYQLARKQHETQERDSKLQVGD